MLTHTLLPHGSHTFNARHSDPLQSYIVFTSGQRALSPASGALPLVHVLCGSRRLLIGSAALRLLLRYLGGYHRAFVYLSLRGYGFTSAALPQSVGFTAISFLSLRGYGLPLCSAPFAKQIFFYSPTAGMVAFYCYRLLQGSGGASRPTIPPPLCGTAYKAALLCAYARLTRRVPSHYCSLKKAAKPNK